MTEDAPASGPGGAEAQPGTWVLLAYRVPREPSRPRIAVWRKLERLGVARLGDGLVGLPADARTREQIGWIADEVGEAGGAATVWLAQPTTRTQEREIAEGMRTARAAEYQALLDQAAAAATETEAERTRALRRLRGELRQITRRDFFPPPQRDLAKAAIGALAVPETAATDAPQVQP
ncbi:Chromate resistance protein ChrB [Pseudofrankia sp. DC12]|uniref:Chromate resistance protein ChrB n=1 Tax=Pseudofrankia sp. DC12 TaxID=683315 RepID=UPI0005F836C3|nr:Chromate resistance protein ChrB [Pseudofrankia sp. DC12]